MKRLGDLTIDELKEYCDDNKDRVRNTCGSCKLFNLNNGPCTDMLITLDPDLEVPIDG